MATSVHTCGLDAFESRKLNKDYSFSIRAFQAGLSQQIRQLPLSIFYQVLQTYPGFRWFFVSFSGIPPYVSIAYRVVILTIRSPTIWEKPA
ncbi:hypothetical protein AcV5_000889 [Taiwanofungus camphoratus]|nr:hypothetical protein AcV5_000889 [Antrodia cinnamomea]